MLTNDGSSVPKPRLQPIGHDLEVFSTARETRLVRTFPIMVLEGVETRIPRDCSIVQGTPGSLGTPHMMPPVHVPGN